MTYIFKVQIDDNAPDGNLSPEILESAIRAYFDTVYGVSVTDETPDKDNCDPEEERRILIGER